MLLPGFLALLGCTYPRAVIAVSAAIGPLAIVAIWVARRIGRRCRTPAPGKSPAASGVASAVIISSVCLAVGTAMGLFWEARAEYAKVLAARDGLTGVVVVPLEYPDASRDGRRCSFRALVRTLEGDSGWLGVEASAFRRDEPRFVPGAPVRCDASFEVPLPAMNPGGFDYRAYLYGERVFSLLDIQGILPGDEAGDAVVPAPSPVFCAAVRASSAAKAYMESALEKTFPGREAAILKGVFLGDRGDLSPEDARDFKRSGFYRFIAISGFHVELLASFAEAALRRLTKRPSFSRCAAVSAAFVYGGLSGWTAGTVRAFVSAAMRMLAPPLRRKYHPLAGTGVSALAVAFLVPRPLANTGFMLSFAGAGGAWLGGIYADAASRRLRAQGYWDTASSAMDGGRRTFSRARLIRLVPRMLRALTMSCVLFPIVALCFTEVSLASFILSGVWGAITTLAVPLSAVVAFVPHLGAAFGWMPYTFLQGIRAISRRLSAVPIAGMIVPAPSVVEIGAYWALLLIPLTSGAGLGAGRAWEDAFDFFRRRRLLAWLRRCVLAGAPAALFAAAVLRAAVLWPEVTFLYVGEADCAIIRRGASVMMVDTGTSSAFDSHVLPFLRAKGIARVDLCVISHMHSDHAGGLPELCRSLPVRRVAVPPGYAARARDLITSEGALSESAVPEVVELLPGRRYSWAGTTMRVLLPALDSAGTEGAQPDNDSSLAFVLDLGSFEVEFWGDSPVPSISKAFAGNPWLSTPGAPLVIKVPHHGSADAYLPVLYERLRGDLAACAVISVGPNSYGHPSKHVEQAASEGALLARTDRGGAVTVRHVLGRLRVSIFLKNP